MRIFEDILDDLSSIEDDDTTISKLSNEELNNYDNYDYCMAICLSLHIKTENKIIVNLKDYFYKLKYIVDIYNFFDDYVIENCVRIRDSITGTGKIINDFPEECDIYDIYKSIRYFGKSHPVIEVRVYFNAFDHYRHGPFGRCFWRMLQSFNQLKLHPRDFGSCIFLNNVEDNFDSERISPLIFREYNGSAEHYHWRILSPELIDKLYDAIVKNPENYEKVDYSKFNFIKFKIINKVNLEFLSNKAAQIAEQYGVSLIPGKTQKVKEEKVYNGDRDESYVTFTVKPLNTDSIEIYDLEEIMYNTLIKYIPYPYLHISNFAIILKVDGKITNQYNENIKQRMIEKYNNSFRYRKLRFDRERDLKFVHNKDSVNGFYTHDARTVDKKWNEYIRVGSLYSNYLDNIFIIIGDKDGKTFKRTKLHYGYPIPANYNEIINNKMLGDELWEN